MSLVLHRLLVITYILQLWTLTYNAVLPGSLHWLILHFLQGDRSHLCDVAKVCSGCPGRLNGVPGDKQFLPCQIQTWYGAEKCATCRKLVVFWLYLDSMLWSCLSRGEEWGMRVQPVAACSEAESLRTTGVRQSMHMLTRIQASLQKLIG